MFKKSSWDRLGDAALDETFQRTVRLAGHLLSIEAAWITLKLDEGEVLRASWKRGTMEACNGRSSRMPLRFSSGRTFGSLRVWSQGGALKEADRIALADLAQALAGECESALRLAERRSVEGRAAAQAGGEPVEAFVSAQSQKVAEKAWKQRDAEFAMMTDGRTKCIVLTDAGGLATAVSPTAREVLGYAPARLLGSALEATIHGDDRPMVAAARLKALTGQDCPAVEFRLRHGSGRWIRIEASFQPSERVFPSDQPTLKIEMRDVTLRWARREVLREAAMVARRAGRAQAEFLATMSHEIRLPLNAVIGSADLLKNDPDLTANQREHVERMEQAGQALLAVVNDILDTSALDGGTVVLDSRSFDPRALLKRCVSLVMDKARSKKLAVDIEIAPEIPRLLVADDHRLAQVVSNLLSNAVKFTAEGRIGVRLERREAEGGAEIVCSVTDTGKGIPADRIDQVFARYAQADGSIARTYGGSGLGLAICRQLVTLMGGTIGVESREGKGSRFWFTLPELVATVAAEPAEEPLAPAAEGAVRILLVDDDEMSRVIAAAMLRDAGHDVTEAPSGFEAIRQLHGRDGARGAGFDLILLDVQMPDMDGVQTLRLIRDMPGVLEQTAVVALTAAVLPEQVRALRSVGFDDHLGKPFRRDDLMAVVARWSGVRRQAGEGAGAGKTVLDERALAELSRQIGQATVDCVLSEFSAHLREMLALLCGIHPGLGKQALGPRGGAAADPKPLIRHVHQLVSSSGMLGFRTLCRTLADFEAALLDPAAGDRRALETQLVFNIQDALDHLGKAGRGVGAAA
ncbi:MAG: ATP-binding protein [Alsobacter sp.]